MSQPAPRRTWDGSGGTRARTPVAGSRGVPGAPSGSGVTPPSVPVAPGGVLPPSAVVAPPGPAGELVPHAAASAAPPKRMAQMVFIVVRRFIRTSFADAAFRQGCSTSRRDLASSRGGVDQFVDDVTPNGLEAGLVGVALAPTGNETSSGSRFPSVET